MINRPWLDAVLSNTTPVESSAIALLINLLAAGADPLLR
jgi:hypothetical protein